MMPLYGFFENLMWRDRDALVATPFALKAPFTTIKAIHFLVRYHGVLSVPESPGGENPAGGSPP